MRNAHREKPVGIEVKVASTVNSSDMKHRELEKSTEMAKLSLKKGEFLLGRARFSLYHGLCQVEVAVKPSLELAQSLA